LQYTSKVQQVILANLVKFLSAVGSQSPGCDYLLSSFKLGFYRVQGARIAKRTVKKSRKTEDGCTKYDGVAIREMGDADLIDCNVTGSNEGTSDAPKFSLLILFRDRVFPKVLELVSNGGQCNGYFPVFQGDNAGPHIDGTYHDFVNDYCESKGCCVAVGASGAADAAQ
jgi:hypothetical protein